MQNIYEALYAENIECEKNILLSSLSAFKVGGIASYIAYPKNEYELSKCVCGAKQLAVRFEIIGNASNVLFSDNGYDGIIICTKKMTFVSSYETHITAQCGVRLSTLSSLARDNSLSGLEFAYGIPGTAGGAIAMNAGAFGGEMSDVVISSRAINIYTGEIVTLDAQSHNFAYRKSIYTDEKSLICTLINLELKQGNKEDIDAKMKANAITRRDKQPLDLPSCGSYFKRPDGYIAAKLIDDLGLKGLSVGDAMVSEKHAGFIVNVGKATATDILKLEDIIKEKVFKEYGIELSREVRYVE